MNKTVLEKLIHGFNLVKPEVVKSGKSKFTDHFTAAEHMKDNTQKHGDVMIEPKQFYRYMKNVSLGISQSAKFYIEPPKLGEDLTNKEKTRIAPEVEMFLPYESVYVQYASPYTDVIYNLWAIDAGYKSQPKGSPYEQDGEQPVISVILMPYAKNTGRFHMDYCAYDMSWHSDGSYTFWINDRNQFKDWIDLAADRNGQYTNRSLNNYISVCNEIIFELCLRLQYPSIVEEKNREGIEPSARYSELQPKQFKASTFLSKPTWQHKTLKLNMYGNKDTKLGKAGARESGTAFHSVRKHMRRLPTGKTIFVKAHFRGQREVGTILKDYELTA